MRSTAALWRTHLLVTARRLARSPGHAAVTIGGLAFALAGCLLMAGYLRYERGYDSWLPDHDRVFQLQSTIHPPGQPAVRTQTSTYAAYGQLGPTFPQVEAVTSLSVGKTVTERDGAPVFIEATTVDPSFFRVFALPFRQGSAATALRDPLSIVLTESEAIRWFGTPDALGRRLTLGAGDGRRDHRVDGVLRDLPRNSNLRLALLFHRDVTTLPPDKAQWGNFDNQHFVKLRHAADLAAVEAGLPAWKDRVIPSVAIGGAMRHIGAAFDFHLVPITAVHLGAAQAGAIVPGGDPRALATFAVVALLTLGMAIINFVNLATARATRRAREVGLRKVLGATRRQLVAQFLAEGLLLCAAATLLAFAIVEVATPWVGALLGADLPIAYRGAGGMLLPALALAAITGLAGGLYPALVLSRFRPATTLRSGPAVPETPGGRRLRAALVVVQFAIAIGLIASTAVIAAQTRFVQCVDPGYRRDGLIQVDNAWRFTQGAEFEAARAALLAVPGITGVAREGLGLGGTATAVRLTRLAGASGYVSMEYNGIDADLLATMRVPLLAGRLLGDRFATDRIAGEPTASLARRGIAVVLNRTAARALGFDANGAVGRPMQVGFDGGTMVPATIVGVVADTRTRSAREAIEPTVYAYDPAGSAQVLVRYAAQRPRDAMAAVARVWRQFEPAIPFEARFVDDIVRELYAAERARLVLFAAFAALAVGIACLGLYGLAAFTVERRTREIGIRKVLGAQVRHIVRLLAWQFCRPVILANLVSWPVAWWAMRDWLNGFDQRIALTPGPFAAAGLLALGIALATVAGHALRVARLSPIHALRYE